MKKCIVALLFMVTMGCNESTTPDPEEEFSFNFAYFTDTHLNMGNNGCFAGYEKAISDARTNTIDFIMTGGDNVDIDGLKSDAATAHKLYGWLANTIKLSGIKFYPTIGNHDRFFGVGQNDPLYNQGLFEKYLGKSYYSFDHKGWHIIVLNTSNSVVEDAQKQWLADDLKKVAKDTPIIVSVHVPFLSVYYPALEGKYTSADTFSNFKEIWDMFEEKNLKLVLQGHMHLYEDIKVKGVQFITAGSVAANWWSGPYFGTEEGYVLVRIKGKSFTWEYVDFGWEAYHK